jgi:hypothetical protein
VLLAGAIASCSAPAARAPAGRVDGAHGVARKAPSNLLEQTRALEDRLRTLRARFVATTRHDGELRESEGALVVAKPDRFRMRLLLPFGLSAADVGVAGSRTWVFLPQGEATMAGSPVLFPQQDLRAIFLRGDAAWPGRCRVLERSTGATSATPPGSEASIECRTSARGPILRTARVDRHAAVREEVSFDGARPRTIARYDDLRSVDGFVLPYRITLEDPGRGVIIEIRIVRYEVNPTLAPDLFLPPT